MKNNPIKPNTKIRILSSEHFEHVQEIAFDAGCIWYAGETSAIEYDKEYCVIGINKDCRMSLYKKDQEGYIKDMEEIYIPLPSLKDPVKVSYGVSVEGKAVLLEAPNFESADIKVELGGEVVHEENISAKILSEKIGSKHSHYFKDVSDLDEIDVYRVCDLFEVNDTSGAIQHALKKLLCSGQRGVKGYRKDLEEARDSITRKLDIMKEDGE